MYTVSGKVQTVGERSSLAHGFVVDRSFGIWGLGRAKGLGQAMYVVKAVPFPYPFTFGIPYIGPQADGNQAASSASLKTRETCSINPAFSRQSCHASIIGRKVPLTICDCVLPWCFLANSAASPFPRAEGFGIFRWPGSALFN